VSDQHPSATPDTDPSQTNPASGIRSTPKVEPTIGVAPYPKPSRAWYAVLVLMFLYIFSFIDRQIISLLVEPMKRDLQISDTQIGLLQGLAFALLYTVLGLPIGRLADRFSRRGIIAAGVLVWSIMATLCGLARSAGQLFLARVGVGVGEAALSPAAYSLITDYFPREKLGRAFSVYNMGITIGSGVALLVGGLVVGAVSGVGENYTLPIIGEVRAWQLVFIVTGAPGLLLPLLLISVREPTRRGLLKGGATDRSGAPKVIPFREVLRFVVKNRDFYFPHFLAMGLLAMVGYGVAAWLPTTLIRTYGVTAPEVGKVLGLCTLLLNSSGILLAGRVCDRLTAKGRTDAPMLVCFGVTFLIVATSVIVPLMPSVTTMWIALMISTVPFNAYNGMGPMAVNQVTPNQFRGQVSAIYLFVVNIVGMGLGPVLVPTVSDFIFKDPAQIRYGLVFVVLIGCASAAALLSYARPRFRQKLAAAAEWQ
jgi:MFS family permease